MSAAEQQAAALQQLRSEVQAQAQRDLMTKMTEKCFAKCAANSKGGSRLERSARCAWGCASPVRRRDECGERSARRAAARPVRRRAAGTARESPLDDGPAVGPRASARKNGGTFAGIGGGEVRCGG